MNIGPQTRICLISADGHVGAPTKTYRDYLEKSLHSDFDDFYAHHRWRWSAQSEDSFFPPEWNLKMRGTEGFDPQVGAPVAWDPKLRLQAQQQSQLACEILFPDDQNGNDPPWGAGLATGAVAGGFHRSFVRAGARAYNRWLADFCSSDPAQLRGLTLVGTMEDPVWCVDEIRRAYDSGLRTGVMLPLDYDQPYYHHPRYDMIWETCQELGLAVVTHVAQGHPPWLGDDPWVQRFLYMHEANWYAQRPIWCMIMGGVFERYPNLRLVITELGIDWVPPLLGAMDHYMGLWPNMRASRDVAGRVVKLQMQPSEYWRRNVFVGHTVSQRREDFAAAALDAVPNMLFGVDIGHGEGWWPMLGWPETPAGMPAAPPTAIEEGYKQVWSGLPAGNIMPYFEYNSLRAYPNIDREALQPAVDRFGPTVAEIGLAV